jgi:gas vesicle protein
MNIGKIVCGALAGFAVGVIAGLLFAPEEGSDNRAGIMNMRDAYVNQIKIRLDEPMKAIAEIYGGIKHLTEEIAKKGKPTNEESIKRV